MHLATARRRNPLPASSPTRGSSLSRPTSRQILLARRAPAPTRPTKWKTWSRLAALGNELVNTCHFEVILSTWMLDFLDYQLHSANPNNYFLIASLNFDWHIQRFQNKTQVKLNPACAPHISATFGFSLFIWALFGVEREQFAAILFDCVHSPVNKIKVLRGAQ